MAKLDGTTRTALDHIDNMLEDGATDAARLTWLDDWAVHISYREKLNDVLITWDGKTATGQDIRVAIDNAMRMK